jgi:hypothetical protein
MICAQGNGFRTVEMTGLLHVIFAAGAVCCCAMPARAQVRLGTVAGSDVAIEGLWQLDGNWFENDVADLDGRSGGRDRATGLRRAELALRGGRSRRGVLGGRLRRRRRTLPRCQSRLCGPG